MKNMGFGNLELVNPVPFHKKEAKWMACQAYDMVRHAVVHDTFEDAVKDKGLIAGTTRRLGRRRGLILPLKDSVKRIITTARNNRVAILFGRERNGLSNYEIDECGFLITIPSNPEAASLNLAQSVLLVAYELAQKTYKKEFPELVEHARLAALYERIDLVLKLFEYIPRGDRSLEKKIIKNLKHFIGRAGMTEWELNMIHGILTQVERKGKVEGGKVEGSGLNI
jgi:TrmH family RNA methyltransferase